MGMTEKQYWEGDPQLAVAYREAYRLQRKLQNEQAWLQGLYMYDAFAVVLANAFSKRGSKKLNYFDKPLDIFPLTEEERAQKVEEENRKMQEAMKAIMREQRRKKKQKGD